MSSNPAYSRVVELSSHQQQRADLEEQKRQAIEDYDKANPDFIEPQPVEIPAMNPTNQKILDSLVEVLEKVAIEFTKDKQNNTYYERTLRLFSANQKNRCRMKTSLSAFHNRSGILPRRNLTINDKKGLIGQTKVYQAIDFIESIHRPVHVINIPGSIFHGCELSYQPYVYEDCYENVKCRKSCSHIPPARREYNTQTYCEIVLEISVPKHDRTRAWLPEWFLECFGCIRI